MPSEKVLEQKKAVVESLKERFQSAATGVFVTYSGLTVEKDTELRLFGKPELKGHRRMGVLLARRDNVEDALETVKEMRKKVEVKL